jgi:membrane protein required for colicin V production
MEPYDIAMVVILVGATAYGFFKGMAWQLASLASLVASYFASLHLSGPLAPYFGKEAPWNKFAAMAAIYLGSGIAIWLAFRLVSAAIDRVKLAEFDRQVGAIFGAFKGALVCLAITFFAVTLSTAARDKILHTKSGYAAAWVIDQAHPIIPAEMHEVLEPYIHQLDAALPEGSHHHAHEVGEGRGEPIFNPEGYRGLTREEAAMKAYQEQVAPPQTARRPGASTRPLDTLPEDISRELGDAVLKRLKDAANPPPSGSYR